MIKPRFGGFRVFGNRYYYDALYATLIHLMPKNCLEIGTYFGYSTEVFQKYFDNFRPDGKLITLDIKKYIDIIHPSVTQLLVHPYINDSNKYHDVQPENILPPINDAQDNINIVKNVFNEQFDFCFLDGDHNKPSIYNDFKLARALLKEPQYILFDDIDVPNHESTNVYQNEILNNPDLNVYDYGNWNVWIGAALLWNKNER